MSHPTPPHDDSDLEDLIAGGGGAEGGSLGDEDRVPLVVNKAAAPPNSSHGNGIDSRSSKQRVHKHLQPQRASATGFSYHPEQASCLQYVTAYASLCCYYHPWLCSSLAVGLGVFFLLTLANLVFNPVQEFGILHHDHSNIRSKYDLNMTQIDHWCLGGGNVNCLCEDPLTPTSQMNRKAWVNAFAKNRQAVRSYAMDPHVKGRELDVAFLGESLVELMAGRWLGMDDIDRLAPYRQDFASRFQRDNGAKHEGVALGIAGDTAPNVLYRLMHGEMLEQFQPKVWWLILGMNDLSRMRCSEEVVVIGILRVVEEVLESHPSARIVINSLLPMEYSRGGPVALLHDYADADQQQLQSGGARFERKKKFTGNDEKDGWRRRRSRTLRQRKKKNKSSFITSGGGTPRKKGSAAAATEQAPAPQDEEKEELEQEQAIEDQVLKREGKRPRGHTNAVLDSERHKNRKYNPLSVFTKKKQPPLWTSIYAINRDLKKFADHHDRVDFFDATPIFTSKIGGGKYRLVSSQIDARGRPTAAGFRTWEDGIVRRLEEILAALRVEHPELFSPLDMGNDDPPPRNANETEVTSWYIGDDASAPEMYLPHDGDDYLTADDIVSGGGNGDFANEQRDDGGEAGGGGIDGTPGADTPRGQETDGGTPNETNASPTDAENENGDSENGGKGGKGKADETNQGEVGDSTNENAYEGSDSSPNETPTKGNAAHQDEDGGSNEGDGTEGAGDGDGGGGEAEGTHGNREGESSGGEGSGNQDNLDEGGGEDGGEGAKPESSPGGGEGSDGTADGPPANNENEGGRRR